MKIPASVQHDKSTRPVRKTPSGFTIIELLVVVAIIGVLSAIGIASFSSLQSGARDTQRSSKITIISEALEKYYSKYGEYPSCADIANPVSSATVTSATLKGLDPDTLTAPSAAAGTNSFSSCSVDPTSDTFSYIGGVSRYTLKYKEEGTGTVISVASRKHDAVPTFTLTIAAGTGGTVNAGGSYELGSTPTIEATPSSYYSFDSWSGTDCSGSPSHIVTINANMSCTANFTAIPIATPIPDPVVTANTVGATTTWSWGAASCPGNTARYQYDYTYAPAGYDSGWTAYGSTSVPFTTSTGGQTYTVAVQAQCYNTATSSSWSGSGSAFYYNPTVNYTLTINAGANGTVNSGGSYAAGSTPTITATPSTYYSFSSWTGSTGCSGVASHTIVMDAAKSCTANFTPTAISVPAVPTVSANTVGATTTWSWGAASCPGNTARYQYRYTYAPAGYDSGLIATASTSVGFTTSTEGQTYTVAVQAQCYNTATTSAWSTAGSAGYYRATTNYTLTIAAGAGGTVNSGGTYASGSTPTITATPSTYYSFSSWTGDTGCSGVASHTITMDANKTCTANFTPTAISVPAVPSVSANTVGATTTWSWGAASCPGNTARYQYRYTYTPTGYDSGLVAYASTSIPFTTSTQGQTYTVAVQAQCYNTATSSAWSTAGSASYLRPVSGSLVALSPATIATGVNPRGIKISADGTSVYVANTSDWTVSMYSRNTSTGQLTALSPATIATDWGPTEITISADGKSVYVTNYSGYRVSMYSRNTSTGQLTALAVIDTGSNPSGITISADGTSVYVANYGSSTVSMYTRNTTTGLLTAKSPATIVAGSAGGAIDVTISADGTSVYTANYGSSNVSMFSRSTTTGLLTAKSPATIALAASSYPMAITISADGTSVYVSNSGGTVANVAMFSRSTTTGLLTALSPATLYTGSQPQGITISSDGKWLYLAKNCSSVCIGMISRNTSTGQLSLISANSPAGTYPREVTISSDTNFVYSTNYNSSTISMYSRVP